MKPLFYGLVDGLSHFHAVVRTVSFEFGFEVRVHLERGHDLADGFAVATAGVVLHVHVRTPQGSARKVAHFGSWPSMER